MRLNLPILDALADSESILIAGVGGGHDVLIGLPIYFALRELGKTVHLANYSFTEFGRAMLASQPETLGGAAVLGARAPVTKEILYFPEGFLTQWFKEERGEDVTVWMLARTGVAPLKEAYAMLTTFLAVDALVLVDGGVDSLMRGDEDEPGTIIEDAISLAAVEPLPIPAKILACLGFGTEVEEKLGHHHALENMAALTKEEAFLGSCSLAPQMEAFQLFEAACRYIWAQPSHPRSHISSRIIPAARGEFGDHHMYEADSGTEIYVSPLMSLYWFFDAMSVIRRSLIIEHLSMTRTVQEAVGIYYELSTQFTRRRTKRIPY